MTSLEGWSSTIELRPQQPPDQTPERLSPRSVPSPRRGSPQREHQRHPRLPRRKPERPVLPPHQPVEPREVVEVLLVQELDPQPCLHQRRDDLAQAVLELHGPLMRKRRPVRIGIRDSPPPTAGVEVVPRHRQARTNRPGSARTGAPPPGTRTRPARAARPPPAPSAGCPAATPAPRPRCRRCRTAARRTRPPRRTRPRPRTSPASPAKQPATKPPRSPGAEKSSPLTSAPRRAQDKVSSPIWHCRCTSRRPDTEPDLGTSNGRSVDAPARNPARS